MNVLVRIYHRMVASKYKNNKYEHLRRIDPILYNGYCCIFHSYKFTVGLEETSVLLCVEMDVTKNIPKQFMVRQSIMGEYVTIVSSVDLRFDKDNHRPYVYLSYEMTEDIGFDILLAMTLILKRYNIELIDCQLIWNDAMRKQKKNVLRMMMNLR